MDTLDSLKRELLVVRERIFQTRNRLRTLDHLHATALELPNDVHGAVHSVTGPTRDLIQLAVVSSTNTLNRELAQLTVAQNRLHEALKDAKR
jgi:hypothetical protein